MAVIRYLIYLQFCGYVKNRSVADELAILPALKQVIHSFEK